MFAIVMIGLNFFLGGVSYLMKRLTLKGAITAGVIGSLIWLGGQFYAWSLLGLFFITSSFWSNYKEERKYHLHHIHEKGSQRDAMQVIANSGVAALGCLGYLITHHVAFLIAIAVSLASATADTWASEIGVLSTKSPRSLLTMKPIEAGLSGGVSFLGSISQLGGAILIGSYATLMLTVFYQVSINGWLLITYISSLGVLGSIFDSLLGGCLQAKYECQICKIETERPIHHEKKAKLIRGIPWMTNDQVNLISNWMVTALALIGYQWLI